MIIYHYYQHLFKINIENYQIYKHQYIIPYILILKISINTSQLTFKGEDFFSINYFINILSKNIYSGL